MRGTGGTAGQSKKITKNQRSISLFQRESSSFRSKHSSMSSISSTIPPTNTPEECHCTTISTPSRSMPGNPKQLSSNFSSWAKVWQKDKPASTSTSLLSKHQITETPKTCHKMRPFRHRSKFALEDVFNRSTWKAVTATPKACDRIF